MNTNKLLAAATPLATLNTLATLGIRRRGNALRVYMPANSMSYETQTTVVRQLLAVGAKVRIRSGAEILKPTLAADGAVVWTSRKSRVERNDHMSIVVTL